MLALNKYFKLILNITIRYPLSHCFYCPLVNRISVINYLKNNYTSNLNLQLSLNLHLKLVLNINTRLYFNLKLNLILKLSIILNLVPFIFLT